MGEDEVVSRRLLLDLAGLASVVAVGCSFLGWARSGRRVRSSFGLFEAAGRAGLLPESIEWLGWLFFLVPAVAGAALVALAIHRVRLAAGLFAAVGIGTSLASLLVVVSPLSVQGPAIVAGFAGSVAVLAAVPTLVLPRKRA